MSPSPSLALPFDETRPHGGLLSGLLSSDLPRSRALSVILLAILALLATTPFLFPGSQPVGTAAKICVFIAGSALAGLGGVMWAFYRQTLTAGMGMEVMVLVFIVIIIGGLGSVGGCFVGSILVALVANYVGFIEPKLALISNILVMALVLIWRPQGLFPVARR